MRDEYITWCGPSSKAIIFVRRSNAPFDVPKSREKEEEFLMNHVLDGFRWTYNMRLRLFSNILIGTYSDITIHI